MTIDDDCEDQIKHMVDRFLSWKLPEHFNPDGGINFDADAAIKLNPRNRKYEPVGTNLFSATQADAMVRYMIEGLLPPAPQATKKSYIKPLRTIVEIDARYADQIRDLLNAPAPQPPVEGLRDVPHLIETIEGVYNFACDAGPLANCGEWKYLKRILAALASPSLTAGEQSGEAAMREALTFYADPFAWKAKHDPDDVVRIPDFYSETSFGDKAADALAAATLIEQSGQK